MLTRIEIRDFALIEKIIMEPGQGLLVLTGETGAGKSILIDAIDALSGARVSREMVRHGQKTAVIEAAFQVEQAMMPHKLSADLGLVAVADSPDNTQESDESTLELILSREITAGGKSVCRINGRLTTLTLLRELASCLIDIHGQHDQQAIFQIDRHLTLLDRYGGEPVARAKAAYGLVLKKYRDCIREMKTLGSDPTERARQIDLLAYQVNEILAAELIADEDEQLTARRKILAHAERIQEALQAGFERLAGEQADAVLSGIGDVLSNLESIQRHTEELKEVDEAVRNAQDILQTVASDLRAACERFLSDPEELAHIDERLDLIYRLKRKYGGSVQAILVYLEKSAAQLEHLNGGEARYAQLRQQQDSLTVQLREKAGILSRQRQQAAAEMEAKTAVELSDLGMKGVRFSVRFADNQAESSVFPEQGLDQVEFLLSANPGEPQRPLARIASGGEASRIMLAIKTILAHVDQMPVLIFDEIDTGVSGQTAARVGEKLMQLARGRQVFCITHMAQIAAMADEHWLIEKQVRDNRTRTGLRLLLEQERETELARLLSGGVADQTARQLAGQLRSSADKRKGSSSPT